MSSYPQHQRLPWEDRWRQPDLEQLLEPMSEPQQKSFQVLIDQLSQFEHVRHQIAWYGVAWHWTIRFELQTPDMAEPEMLCFLIPRTQSAELCIPLSQAFIEQLPVQQLNRAIRERIELAKCALEVHWATWSPSNQTETEHLVELLTRKYEDLAGLALPAREADKPSAKKGRASTKASSRN